ncbi:hypothetical protein CNAG_03883 [Cryptococcus neoformans var. grubii H99]|uniref:Uncharacterized protein n=2 Tax=Cryptococcus neoformans (strain H99 / ATCC 208821 / CBS 10515 / FGSC 9487) TaxID=235443 RepID=J9VGX1_CRYN9|nr:hypothetical protein CNAG_03883 [Cryptococcus neoformans var. grubii H99]AFR93383.2 hypothetical protein CNAG_03883 [Cryptococcus neoformans var. grubii H99]AUB22926.1 hypothetical protein CKF44_03883 [Cryptococcus neoformans var. grubii]|eukprot:XP_012047259.1 hypothetical protein CNAG_03883 [Cryptococcus neoformans var. grubii H99]
MMTANVMPYYYEHGWYPDIHLADERRGKNGRKKVSMEQFYAFGLFDCPGSFNTALHCGPLFQELVVDAFEFNHLRFHEKNQDNCRREVWQGVVDSAEQGLDAYGIGTQIILLSSFINGPLPFLCTISGCHGYDDDSYPIYRRREGDFTWKKKIDGIDYTFTNRDVVPYNPYLLEYYKCHMNVEVCTSITVVKYFYKYIYKGSDGALTGVCENDASDTVQNQLFQN